MDLAGCPEVVIPCTIPCSLSSVLPHFANTSSETSFQPSDLSVRLCSTGPRLVREGTWLQAVASLGPYSVFRAFSAVLLSCSFPDYPRYPAVASSASQAGCLVSLMEPQALGDRDYGSCFLDASLHPPHLPRRRWYRASERAVVSVIHTAFPISVQEKKRLQQIHRTSVYMVKWPHLGSPATLGPYFRAIRMPSPSLPSLTGPAHPCHTWLPDTGASPRTPCLRPLCLRPLPLQIELSS